MYKLHVVSRSHWIVEDADEGRHYTVASLPADSPQWPRGATKSWYGDRSWIVRTVSFSWLTLL